MLKSMIAMIVTLIYTLVMFGAYREDKAIEARGKTTFIKPLDRVTETTTKRRNRAKEIDYTGKIEFETDKGERITVHSRHIPDNLIDKVFQGEPLEIKYLPDKPSAIQFEGETSVDIVEPAVGLMFLFLSIIWFRSELRRPYVAKE